MGMSIDYETRRITLERVFGERGTPAANAATENFAADPWFEILGTNASADDITFRPDGSIRLTTDGADGDGIFILPHLDTEHSPWENITWGTDDEVEWECLIRPLGSFVIYWAGLKLTSTDVVATDDDQVYFRAENDVSSGVWVAQASVKGSDQSAITANAPDQTSFEPFRLGIKFDDEEVCHMFINGNEVFSRSFMGNTVDLKPYICVEKDGAGGAASLDAYWQKISRILK